jgi:NAD(P)-dependent dehydrogenase (short-subunit alcohol dehydrogenase family)
MSNQFGAKSTTDDVLAGVDPQGQARAGHRRLGRPGRRDRPRPGRPRRGCRRRGPRPGQGRGRDRRRARSGAKSGGSLSLIELDLADLASVRAAPTPWSPTAGAFDLVIANAGVMATPFGKTVDGFETQFGTNHLGHFVLINRIASLLKAGSRVVSLASSGHRFSDVNLEDPNFETTEYVPFAAYGRSKTANILFAVEFDRRHKERGVRAVAVHPGGIQTELAGTWTRPSSRA